MHQCVIVQVIADHAFRVDFSCQVESGNAMSRTPNQRYKLTVIVLNLKCSVEHMFEGWFASSEAFNDQASTGLVSCPICGDRDISRLPSGPYIKRTGLADVARSVTPHSLPDAAIKAYGDMIAQSENVAEQFPEEARKIHYGEAPARSIRGKATLQETHDLIEEGIGVLPIPFPVKEDTH